jgi:hypothetical protein
MACRTVDNTKAYSALIEIIFFYPLIICCPSGLFWEVWRDNTDYIIEELYHRRSEQAERSAFWLKAGMEAILRHLFLFHLARGFMGPGLVTKFCSDIGEAVLRRKK